MRMYIAGIYTINIQLNKTSPSKVIHTYPINNNPSNQNRMEGVGIVIDFLAVLVARNCEWSDVTSQSPSPLTGTYTATVRVALEIVLMTYIPIPRNM